jgi:hypothetical protein
MKLEVSTYYLSYIALKKSEREKNRMKFMMKD